MSSRSVARQVAKNSENWVLAVLSGLGTVFFIQTFHYRFSAGLFPRIVNAMLAFLCFYRLYKNIKEASIGRTARDEKKGPVGTGLRWYWSFVITVLYFGMICLVGFVWGTGLFLLAFPIASGYRRWCVIIPVALATAILTELGFSIFLQIPLPEGLLFTLFNR